MSIADLDPNLIHPAAKTGSATKVTDAIDLIIAKVNALNDELEAGFGGTTTKTAAATLVPGAPVYSSSAGGVNKARANAATTALCTGLAAEDIASAASGPVQHTGILVLTAAQWDAVAGTTGGLTYATQYWVSAATAGLLTATAPVTATQFDVLVGVALSTTELFLTIQPPLGPIV